MTVVVKFRLASGEFEVGEILRPDSGTVVRFESLVPGSDRLVPFIWVFPSDLEAFVNGLHEGPTRERVEAIDVFEDCVLLALDWDVRSDRLFRGINDCEGVVLAGVGTADAWEFDIRFRSHEKLSRFRRYCSRTDIELTVLRVYRAAGPDSNQWEGVTKAQREALTLAVKKGYYTIPRRCTTAELAETLGISGQSVTERLRRGIVNLTKAAYPLETLKGAPFERR